MTAAPSGSDCLDLFSIDEVRGFLGEWRALTVDDPSIFTFFRMVLLLMKVPFI